MRNLQGAMFGMTTPTLEPCVNIQDGRQPLHRHDRPAQKRYTAHIRESHPAHRNTLSLRVARHPRSTIGDQTTDL